MPIVIDEVHADIEMEQRGTSERPQHQAPSTPPPEIEREKFQADLQLHDQRLARVEAD